MKPTLDTYESMLKRHDWYYDYSDDYRVWRKWDDHSQAMQQVKRQLIELGMEEQCNALLKQYLPKD